MPKTVIIGPTGAHIRTVNVLLSGPGFEQCLQASVGPTGRFETVQVNVGSDPSHLFETVVISDYVAPSSDAAEVTVNATGTKLYTGTPGSSINYTGLTVAAGSNTAIVGLLFVDGNTNISGITANWDSGGTPQALTQIIEMDNTIGEKAIYIFALAGEHGAVAIGNKTLNVAWTGSQKTFFVAMAFDGVNQTGGATSFPNAIAGLSSSTISVTSAIGNKVIGLESSGSPQGTSTGTLIFDDHVSGALINVMCQYDNGATTVSIGNSGGNINLAACDIQAA